MVRVLSDKDNEQLMSFLKKEKSINLFIIGDIENYGYKNDFQKIWGETDECGNFKGVLLKYYKNFVFYSVGECQFEEFADLIKKHKYDVISGKKSSIEKIRKYFGNCSKKDKYFTELTKPISYLRKENNVESINVDEIEDLFELRKTIEEFSAAVLNADAIKKDLKTKSGRIYCIRKSGRIISSAATTSENSESAMIVTVCTLKEYRNSGYGTQCVEKLCNDLLSEGKTLCLFYDNPLAGKIYKKIGFKDIGKWTMLNPKKKNASATSSI